MNRWIFNVHEKDSRSILSALPSVCKLLMVTTGNYLSMLVCMRVLTVYCTMYTHISVHNLLDMHDWLLSSLSCVGGDLREGNPGTTHTILSPHHGTLSMLLRHYHTVTTHNHHDHHSTRMAWELPCTLSQKSIGIAG